MPVLIFPAFPGHGPIITVDVEPSLPYQRVILNGSSAPTVTDQFLLDTGSSHSLIDEGLISAWGITSKTPRLISSAGSSVQAHGWAVDLAFYLYSGNRSTCCWAHGALSVTTAPSIHFQGRRFSGLIGRDVLDLGQLLYDGPTQTVTLSW